MVSPLNAGCFQDAHSASYQIPHNKGFMLGSPLKKIVSPPTFTALQDLGLAQFEGVKESDPGLLAVFKMHNSFSYQIPHNKASYWGHPSKKIVSPPTFTALEDLSLAQFEGVNESDPGLLAVLEMHNFFRPPDPP